MCATLAPLLLLLAADPPAAPAPPSDAELVRRLTSRLEARAAERRFSGELLVSRGAQLLIHRGFGGVTASADRPGVYAVGSISKTFTATAVLLLARQGKLRLEDPLSRHFPEVDASRLTREGRAVTLDDLLTQTSGLTGMVLPLPAFANQRPPDTVARMLAEAQLDTTPGSAYRYCNQCYVVLGEVVRRVSGAPSYDQFIREQIARPLGLRDTGIVPGADQRARLQPGQVGSVLGLHAARRLMPHRLRETMEWTGAASGGVRSTAPDLARLFGALAAGELIGPELRALMFTVKLDGYARGLIVSPLTGDHRLVWHNGALSPLGYHGMAGVLLGPDPAAPPLLLVVQANVDLSVMNVDREVLGAFTGAPPRAYPNWTFERIWYALSALYVGPLMATVALALFLWRRRRPATTRAWTLLWASVLLGVVAIGVAGTRTPVFAGSLLFAVVAVAAELRRRPPGKSNADTWAGAAAAAFTALLVLAFVLLTRAL